LLALAACYESATEAAPPRIQPAQVRWLEWPARVSTVVGESLRVVVYAPCGTPRIGVTSDETRIVVSAEEIVNADGSCLGLTTGIYDTMVPLPALHPAEPPSLFQPVPFAVVAPVANYVSGALEQARLGVLELTFRPPSQAVRLVAGRARMSVDTGCAWARLDGQPAEAHLIANPLPEIVVGQPPRLALIGGTFVALNPAACGRTTGIQLRYAQVDLLP